MRNASLMVVALVALCASPVFAGGGGGGGKTTAKIKVTNNSDTAQVVLAGANPATIGATVAGGDVAVTAAGGVTINPGQSFTFTNLAVGNNLVVFVRTGSAVPPAAGESGQIVVKLTAGATRNLSIAGAAATGFSFLVQMVDLPRDVMFASLGLAGLALLAGAGYMVNRKKA